MISAGRILIRPRGAFVINTQYEMLDLVSYNGSSYLALTTTMGNLPTDTTKWMLSAYGGNAANVAGNFAVIETTGVATVQHPEGTLFVDENSQFMKATQTINIGDSIVSGTNCTPTTVEQLINEIAAYVDGLDSQNRKLFGGTEIAAQTDLHSLAIGEYYKSKTTFYVTNGPDGISNVTSAVFRLTIEAALKDGSTASSPLLLTLRTPGGKIYTQNFDGSTWGEWTILSEQIEAAENGISDIVNVLGAKNLIPYPYHDGDSVTRNGITFTVNADKSITAVGTATSSASYTIAQSETITQSGVQYKLNGCPSNGGSSTYRLETYESNATPATVAADFGNTTDGVAFVGEGHQRAIRIVIYPAAGEVSLTFYPMIRPKNIEDDTWQPYTKTNKELTAEVTQNSSDIQTLTNNVSANATAIAKCETLVVSVASFSALPQTITNANIEDDMVVVNSVLSNPSAQTGDWTVTTSSGSLTISGSISGSTTATLYLMKSR